MYTLPERIGGRLNIVPIIAVAVLLLLTVVSCASPGGTASAPNTVLPSTPTQVAAATNAPTATVLPTATPVPPTDTPRPTNTPAPTDTPAPTNTPAPTDTPEPTATPKPTEAPLSFSGTGDGIVNLPEGLGARILHAVGNKAASNFVIWTYNADNERQDLLVNTIEPYDGYRPLDFLDSQTTARLVVKATGQWKIDVLPITMGRTETVPSVIKGKGDDVILLGGGTPDTASISGNKAADNFVVWGYSRSQGRDLLVNETEPYEGVIMLATDTFILEVKAVGDWSIDVKTK